MCSTPVGWVTPLTNKVCKDRLSKPKNKLSLKFILELVHYITQDFLLRRLDGEFSDIACTGSNYEYTTVPGKSDYDIQFYLNLRGHQPVTVRDSHHPGWKYVRGGPKNLQTFDGYLPTSKVSV